MINSSPTTEIKSLAGLWRLQLDREDVGVAERWFERMLTDSVTLPGSLPAQGIGDPVTVETPWVGSVFDPSYFTQPEYAPYREPGNIKVPFWLQPETHYAGVAWYQREVEIPASWAGRRLFLRLERPHWRTTVWLDTAEIGSHDALSVPHDYELGLGVATGRHVLSIRVDNRVIVDIGENSHSISDHTQGNWNGIVGEITMGAGSPVRLADVQVYPNVRDKCITVRGLVARHSRETSGGRVRLRVVGSGRPGIELPIEAEQSSFSATLELGEDAPTWDEFNPVVQHLQVELQIGEWRDSRTVPFGLREISREGRQLLINGRPLFLRGTLDCAAYPKTGHAPMDEAGWRRVFGIVQSHGLNHVRFHSWCPPEAAFVVADELGLYLQVEAASWPNQGTVLGSGHPVDAWTEAETQRISRAYGNHPSLVLMCAGNEPDGPLHQEWLDAWVARHRARDPRPLYTAGAGWPEVAASDFHIRSAPRIQHWEEGLASRINATPPETCFDYATFIEARDVPVVSHEIGQWCAFPDFSEMEAYTGYLKPRNLEIFQTTLADRGMSDQARDFLMASGALQALCYKEDIESALRTAQMGGFQLLGLSDFPGQGTALVGVLNAFWEHKGYITAEAFRRFCGPTVPLARLAKRVFTSDERLIADIEVAHFGASPLRAVVPTWRLLRANGEVVAQGELPAGDVGVGAENRIGRIDIPLLDVPVPARYRLEMVVAGFANDWDVWVYAATSELRDRLRVESMVVDRFDEATQARLEAGETVVLMLRPDQVAPDPQRGPIAIGFSSIFWNTAWTNGQAPHTLGVHCDPTHPALALFPTESHSNWQWWFIMKHAAAMIMDGLPTTLRPIVQVVDDWVTNRKLGLVWEARVGAGRLLVTSVDLTGELDPVRRQLRASLWAHVTSEAFAPSHTVSVEQVTAIVR